MLLQVYEFKRGIILGKNFLKKLTAILDFDNKVEKLMMVVCGDMVSFALRQLRVTQQRL